MNDLEQKSLAKELTKIYIGEWLSSEEFLYSVDECADFFMIVYKQILKKLTGSNIFAKPIDELSKEIALVHTEEYLKRDPQDIQTCVNVFVTSYQTALKIVLIEKPKKIKVPVMKKTSKLPKYGKECEAEIILAKLKSGALPQFPIGDELPQGLVYESTNTRIRRRKRKKNEEPTKGLVSCPGMGIIIGG